LFIHVMFLAPYLMDLWILMVQIRDMQMRNFKIYNEY
jgi:hypothetical protein